MRRHHRKMAENDSKMKALIFVLSHLFSSPVKRHVEASSFNSEKVGTKSAQITASCTIFIGTPPTAQKFKNTYQKAIHSAHFLLFLRLNEYKHKVVLHTIDQ